MSLMIQIQTCQVNIGNPKAQSSNIRVTLYVHHIPDRNIRERGHIIKCNMF